MKPLNHSNAFQNKKHRITDGVAYGLMPSSSSGGGGGDDDRWSLFLGNSDESATASQGHVTPLGIFF